MPVMTGIVLFLSLEPLQKGTYKHKYIFSTIQVWTGLTCNRTVGPGREGFLILFKNCQFIY